MLPFKPNDGFVFPVKCNAGYYLYDGECEPCEVGFYQDQGGALTCVPCDPGQTTRGEGSASEQDCFSEYS